MRVNEVYREFHDGKEIIFIAGKKDVRGKTPMKIIEHEPIREGDVHYCLIEFDDDSAIKVCRPDYIAYYKAGDE